MRKLFEIGGFVAAAILIVFGGVSIAMGLSGGRTVNSQLKQQQIVGESDFTPTSYRAVVAKSGVKDITIPSCSLAGVAVTNGATARCFAEYLQDDALMSTGGYYFSQMGIYTAKPGTPKAQLLVGGGTDNATFAQVDPTTKQPIQNTARNTWVTETALSTALNTAYMASRLALFGIVVGFALLLAGVGFAVLTLGGTLRGARSARVETRVPKDLAPPAVLPTV
jgi:hypothetical protein